MRFLNFSFQGFAFFAGLIIFLSIANAHSLVRVRTHQGVSTFRIHAMGLKTVLLDGKSIGLQPASGIAVFQFEKSSFQARNQKYIVRPGSRLHLEASVFQQGVKFLSNRLVLQKNSKGWDMIQSIAMEDYLLGVLSKEIPLDWPEETIKAQAIASQAYALSVAKERVKQSFDVEGSIMDQHFDSEIFSAKATKLKRLRRLIAEATQYRLMDQTGEPLRAYFHADCGGTTISAAKVWGGKDTPEVQDSYCVQDRARVWTYSFPSEQSLEILQRDRMIVSAPLPRIEKVRWKNEIFGMNEFRQLFGFEKIRSGRFEAKQESGRIILEGVGFGHGVGLCQRGSAVMGRLGKKFYEILNFYFPQAKLESESRS